MTGRSPLLEYVGRIEIIHLRSRAERYRALAAELARIGIPIDHPKVAIPDAPMCTDADGFPSKGVRGNFLSHLQAVERQVADGLETLLVLEDDAIFRSSFAAESTQRALCEALKSRAWDLCFPGHPLSDRLASQPKGLITSATLFKWSHCYMVHARAAPRLGNFLRATMDRPAGHPDGGKMYIDGAFSLWRSLNPDVVTVITNPSVSIQKGSPSGLAGNAWYDKLPTTRWGMSLLRAGRDELWRRTGWPSPREK